MEALNPPPPAEKEEEGSEGEGRGPLWLRRLAWVGIGLLLLWMLAWVAVPPVLKWQLQSRLTDLLGRSVTIGDVGFKPWTLEFTFGDLAIAGTAAGGPAGAASAPAKVEPLLHVQRLHLNLSGSSLFRLAPVIEELDLDAPQLRVAHVSPGHYDIDDLIARLAPKPETKPEPSEPARFALYNLQVHNAQLRFDDRPVGRVHTVDALQLSLPFISNLPAEVEVKVEPRLAFKLNGTSFDSGAQATPFAKERRGTLNWKTGDLDLAPYLVYVPESLPVRIKQGAVSTELAVQFAVPQGGTPTVTLRGTVAARDLVVTDPAGAPLVDWRQLKLGLRDVQPFARKLAFDTLRLEGMQLHVERDAQGQINLLRVASAQGAAAQKTSAAAAASAASAAASEPSDAAASAATPPNPWQVSLDALDLADARVLWNDAATEPAAAIQVDGLSVAVKQVRWPVADGMPLHLAGTLRLQSQSPSQSKAQAQASATAGTFEVDGPVTDREAKLGIKLDAVSLDLLAPYLAQFVTAKIDGKLAAQAQLDWSGAADAPRLKLALDKATLDGVQVRGAGTTSMAAAAATPTRGARTAAAGKRRGAVAAALPDTVPDSVSLKQLALAGVQVDVPARTAAIGSVKLVDPSIGVVRGRDGNVNLLGWLADSATRGAKADAKRGAARDITRDTTRGAKVEPAGVRARSGPAKSAAEPPWRVTLKDFALDGGQLQLSDAAARPDAKAPVRIGLGALRVALQNFEWHGDRAVPPARLAFSARVGGPSAALPGESAGRAARVGLVDWDGQVGAQPLLANGKLRIERLPAHLLEPYAGTLPVDIVRAEAGYNGTVAVRQVGNARDAGLEVRAAGDVLLGDVHVATLPDASTRAGIASADELLNWQALALKGLTFTMKPSAKPLLEIREATISDFYSRLIVTEQGRFNLQDVGAAAAPSASASGAASAPAAASSTAAPSPAASAPADDGLPVDIRVGGTQLVNGKIDFADHFVKPNYSAALTELNGQLGAFRSDSREMATVSLRGRAAGTALLDISGQINPTVKPLALDIRAKATDLELAPLSPYAGKYAGYAIERGKLSMDVAYKIDASGQLNASNQVILNQLTFGEKIASPEATKLPVQLAVALLKDRNGVIDLNLPVSGSINDPQFSVGGIIVRLIFNLIAKALTSPFSLLAGGGGGGGDDLSVVEFVPGTATLTAASSGTIDKVAKALNDRPALKMTVTGAADPASEHESYRQALLAARLVAEQRREALRSGGTPAAPAPPPAASAASSASDGSGPAPMAAPTLSVEERNRLLKEVYKQTDIPNKPRNVLGFQKDIPPVEMEALLTSRLLVTEDAMRELALQRGIAVRDALIGKGLPRERLFLAAPKLRASGEEDGKWTPRVQLTLSTN